MKESFWIYLLMILGLFIIVVMMLIQDLTSTSEEDYYLAKEALEASMVDALDLGLYRQTGEVRIIESKFVESFIRRFAESVNDSKNYTLEFYEIYEMPPKATVFIKTKSKSVKVGVDSEESYDILTAMSGVLETKQKGTLGTTLPDAVTADDDTSTPIITTPVVTSNYVYWTNEQGGESNYTRGKHPTTAKTSAGLLFAGNKGAYIKTETNGKDTNSHSACLYYNGTSKCMQRNKWSDYTDNSKRLESIRSMLSGLNNINCEDKNDSIVCTFDGGECGINYIGSSWCKYGGVECLVDNTDTSYCRKDYTTKVDESLITISGIDDKKLKESLRSIAMKDSGFMFTCYFSFECTKGCTSSICKETIEEATSFQDCEAKAEKAQNNVMYSCPDSSGFYSDRRTMRPVGGENDFVNRLMHIYTNLSTKHMEQSDIERFQRVARELYNNFYVN